MGQKALLQPMSDVIYHLLVILIAMLGAIHGYRQGLTGQVSGVLGLAFGMVGCRVLMPVAMPEVEGVFPDLCQRVGGPLLIEMLTAAMLYTGLYLLLSITTGILRKTMEFFSGGLLNSIIGGMFCVVKYMMFVSIAYNLLVDYNPGLRLLKYGTDRDGNVVEAVMLLAPAALGTHGVDDIAHIKQMEDARCISQNMERRMKQTFATDSRRCANNVYTNA